MKINFQGPFVAPDGASTVLVVRHGAVDAPAPDALIGGRSDPGPNARGREQAVALRARLAREPIVALFTTQLCRTGETAAVILDDHDVTPVELPALGEIYLASGRGTGSMNAARAVRLPHQRQRLDLAPRPHAGRPLGAALVQRDRASPPFITPGVPPRPAAPAAGLSDPQGV